MVTWTSFDLLRGSGVEGRIMRAQYLLELESVRQNLVRMGETAVSLLGESLRAVAEPNLASLEKASELESQTDHQHRVIHDECLSLITRQAPVARDARLVTAVLDAIVDLELIGDYAYEITTLSASIERRPPSQIVLEISGIGAKAKEILTTAISYWRGVDCAPPSTLRSRESIVRAECEALYEKLSKLTAGPGDATSYVNLMLISRHLERILRHAVCVAEQGADAAR
jgi:phosphate transport system protein